MRERHAMTRPIKLHAFVVRAGADSYDVAIDLDGVNYVRCLQVLKLRSQSAGLAAKFRLITQNFNARIACLGIFHHLDDWQPRSAAKPCSVSMLKFCRMECCHRHVLVSSSLRQSRRPQASKF